MLKVKLNSVKKCNRWICDESDDYEGLCHQNWFNFFT